MPVYKIEPNSMHQRFLQSRAKVQIIGGGFGNGKTSAACIKAIGFAADYPGSNGLIARATYPKLNDTIRKEFFKWLPPSSIDRMPTRDDNTLNLRNGTTVNFRYIQQRGKTSIEGATTSNLLSATYDWIIVDQLEDPEIRYKDFLDLIGRLRGSSTYKGDDDTMPISGPRFFIGTLNPTASWPYKKLILPLQQFLNDGKITEDLLYDDETGLPMIELFEGPTTANKQLDEDFIKLMSKAYKGKMRDRFFLGKWGAYEGLVYPAFDTKTHMIPRQDMIDMINAAAKLGAPFDAIEGLDVGIVVPTCYLLGFRDYAGRVFVCDGFYAPTPDWQRIADNIVSIRSKYYNKLRFDDSVVWSDPAIFKRTIINPADRQSDTVAKLLRNATDIIFRAGQNDVTSGIMKVNQYLAVLDNSHYSSFDKPGPFIYFADDLVYIADEFGSYFWTTDPQGERVDKPRDGNDHAMDVIKYMVSRLPTPTAIRTVPVTKRKPYLTQWMEVA